MFFVLRWLCGTQNLKKKVDRKVSSELPSGSSWRCNKEGKEGKKNSHGAQKA